MGPEYACFFPPRGARGELKQLSDDGMALVDWWDETEIEFPNDWWVPVRSLMSMREYMNMLQSQESCVMHVGGNLIHYATMDDGHTYIFKVERYNPYDIEWTVDSS